MNDAQRRLAAALALGGLAAAAPPDAVQIRANQAGYRPESPKRLIFFSDRPLSDRVHVTDAASGRLVMRAALRPASAAR